MAERSPVTALRRLRDSGDGRGFDPAVWRVMGEMGWAGVVAPEAHGGSAFGHLGLGLILEEAGRTLTASPLLSTALIGADALTLGGTAEQQAEWLPRIASGEAVVALAVEERAQHDPARTATQAERTGWTGGDGWRLTGAKTFVLDGMEADLLLVAARHHRTGAPHAQIHGELRAACGGPQLALATADEVQQRIDTLRAWAAVDTRSR